MYSITAETSCVIVEKLSLILHSRSLVCYAQHFCTPIEVGTLLAFVPNFSNLLNKTNRQQSSPAEISTFLPRTQIRTQLSFSFNKLTATYWAHNVH